jgi:hypothetical protein
MKIFYEILIDNVENYYNHEIYISTSTNYDNNDGNWHRNLGYFNYITYTSNILESPLFSCDKKRKIYVFSCDKKRKIYVFSGYNKLQYNYGTNELINTVGYNKPTYSYIEFIDNYKYFIHYQHHINKLPQELLTEIRLNPTVLFKLKYIEDKMSDESKQYWNNIYEK